MNYRLLGKTGLKVSEIGFGGEWLERHDEAESVELLKYAHSKGINIVDCWMADPKSRNIIGKAMEGSRDYGTYKAISDPHTRTGSIPGQGTRNSAGSLLRTCCRG